MILDEIQKAGTVLLLGYGREGKSTEKFLRLRYPNLKIEVADQSQGKKYLEKLRYAQLVIKTPGISPHLPEIVAAKKHGIIFTSSTQLFFELCKGKIIGVTGTKGKSTTASLIYHILQTNGVPSVLVGNIGNPALDQLTEITPGTQVVFELSSHQLMDLTCSPHIAVLLNVVPEHLDYYIDFAEYVAAKLNITQFQKTADSIIFVAKTSAVEEQIRKVSGAGTLIPLSTQDIQQGPWSHLTAQENPLKGQFNWENIASAWEVCRQVGLSDEKIQTVLKSFQPLEGRLELVEGKSFNGIYFYDDRLATVPEATIAALTTLGDQVSTIFLGGADRHQDFAALGQAIVTSQVRTVILFPQTGDRIWKSILTANLHKKNIQHFFLESMDEAVRLAYAHTPAGKAVLMSNASPSFGLFKDYQDKAQQYHQAIKKYAALRALPMTPTAATKPTSRKSSTTGKT